jgi:hypothetical protein
MCVFLSRTVCPAAKLPLGAVRQVVNRKEIVVRVEASPHRRKDRVLAPKSVAKFDVSGAPLARTGQNA